MMHVPLPWRQTQSCPQISRKAVAIEQAFGPARSKGEQSLDQGACAADAARCWQQVDMQVRRVARRGRTSRQALSNTQRKNTRAESWYGRE
jgi:hypothetical protein